MTRRVPSYSFRVVCQNYELDPAAPPAEFAVAAEDGAQYKFVWVASGDSCVLSFELPGRHDVCLQTARQIGLLGLETFGIVGTTITQAFVSTDAINPEYPGQIDTIECTDELMFMELSGRI